MANAPAWKSLKGMRRVQAEYKHMAADIKAKKWGFIKELSLPSDDLLVWHLKLSDFDDDLAGGKQLNEDLRRLKQQYGQDHLLMEIVFPQDYPHQPFFIRVISPRCVMYTGHVTAGGSICLEALTQSGTAGSWKPDFSVESLMNVIVINMIDCPVTYIQTATGPGGRTGPLRVDFNRGNPTVGYSSHESREAFSRTLRNHQRMGWGHDGGAGDQAGAGAAAAAAGAGARLGSLYGAAAGAGAGAGGLYGAGAGAGARLGGLLGAAAAAAAAGAPPLGLAGGGLPSAAYLKLQKQHQEQQQRYQQIMAQYAKIKTHPAGGSTDPGKAQLPAAVATKQKAAAAAAAAARGGGATAAAGPSVAPPPPAAAAAAVTPPSASRRRRKPAKPAAAAVIDLCCSDDDNKDDGTSSDDAMIVGVVPAPAKRRKQPQQQQQQPVLATKKRQHVVVVDSDSDDDSVVAQVQGPKRIKSPKSNQVISSKPSAAGNSSQPAANAAGGTPTSQPHSRIRGLPQRAAALAAQQNFSPPSSRQRNASSAAAAAAAAAGNSSLAARVNAALARGTSGQASADIRQKVMQRLQQRAQQRQQRQQQRQQQQVVPPHREVNAAVEEQVVMGDGANGGPKVQLQLELPEHWDYSQPMDRNTIRLVELPLPGRNGNPPAQQDPLEAAAAAAGVDEGSVGLMQQQGLSRADALAALLLEEGSADEALVRAVTCQELGGAAKVWADMQPARGLDDPLQAAEAAALHQRLVDEAEDVLQRLEATSGSMLSRAKVQKIERVQNAKLWRRYAFKRSDLEHERGRQGLNERLLFHGTSPGTADRIVQEGFDMRLTTVAAYGNGIYFADHSSTAYTYCTKPDQTQYNGGAPPAWNGMGAFPGFMGMGMPFPGMPPVPFPAAVAPPAAVAGGRAGAAAGRAGRGVYKMIIARVALGQQTQGANGMRRPPDGYDSVNSGGHGMGNVHQTARGGGGMYCHVVFDNDQCYPEYLVTLQP